MSNNTGVSELNKNELFIIPAVEILSHISEDDAKSVTTLLNIPYLGEVTYEDQLEHIGLYTKKFSSTTTLMKIVGISGFEFTGKLNIPSEGLTLFYEMVKRWSNYGLIDKFIAKEFSTCPTNTYVAKNPELSSLCKRILEEEGQEGFIIGELHQDYTPKQFLIDNMTELKKYGVTHLFLEHFFYNSIIQRDLRERKMTEILDSYLRTFESNNYNFRKLIESAWANDISVIGIDTDKSYIIPYTGNLDPIDSKLRIPLMNIVANTIITREKRGKYVALVGETHVSKLEGNCLGLADVLNIPSIIFNSHDKDSPLEQINVRNFTITAGERKEVLSRVDYVYNVDKMNGTKGGKRYKRKKL